MSGTCETCQHYEREKATKLIDGTTISYCYEKESRRYGMPHGSIETCTFSDSRCRYYKEMDNNWLDFLKDT